MLKLSGYEVQVLSKADTLTKNNATASFRSLIFYLGSTETYDNGYLKGHCEWHDPHHLEKYR